MTATYSQADEMLIGDLSLTDPGVRNDYLKGAKREIDAKLGIVYELPFDLNAFEIHSLAYLHETSNKIASGRLIMSMAIAGEDGQVNPYGRYLLREGQAMLDALASLQILLDGAERRTDRDDSRLPVTVNYDEESAVTMFEDFALRRRTGGTFWQPGEV